MSIKAIIFDMDGVLVDARDWHYEALNWALNQFGQNISHYDHEKTFDGLPTRKKLEMLTEVEGLPLQLHKLIESLKQKYTMYLIHERCAPYFPHQVAMRALEQEGYKLAVASNSIKNTVTAIMEKTRLSKYLEFYLSNQDVKQGKPHPEIYQKAIQMLGMKPTECLIVEDNENGIRAARASGANVYAVSDIHDVTYDKIKNAIHEANKCK